MNIRSSHPEVVLGKGVLKIAVKFTGKHQCRSVISTLQHGCLLQIYCIFSEHFFLTLCRMGFFVAAHGWLGGGGQKGLHSLKFATHILQWWNLASYTLHKKEPKNIWITWHTPCVVLTSAFFHRKSANLAIFKNRYIDCILAHNLRFFKHFLSLRKFFNKHGYNFDNVSKIGFSSAS